MKFKSIKIKKPRACGAGIINDIDGALVPKGSATRAQTAAILERMNNHEIK